MYLPRYSPEFNLIEQACAKIKERLKSKAAHSRRSESGAQTSPRYHTAQDAKGWITTPTMPCIETTSDFGIWVWRGWVWCHRAAAGWEL